MINLDKKIDFLNFLNNFVDLQIIIEGKWFEHMTLGKFITNYDSLFVLIHFKGQLPGGF